MVDRPAPAACPNCDAPLTGRFCPQCGQRDVGLDPTVREWLKEALGEVFTFDSRIFQSVRPLLFRPGYLTREYNAGRRARYISPLRLYLMISLLLFAVISVRDTPMVHVATEQGQTSPGMLTIMPPIDNEGNLTPADSLDGVPRRLVEMLVAAGEDPDRLNKEVSSYFPKLMFVLLPVFAMLLKLLYIRRKRLYVHHLAFALHVHAYTFVVWAIVGLMGRPTTFDARAAVELALALTVPLYLLLAIKRVYGQGWFKSGLKTVLLGVIYLGVFATGLMTLVGISLAMR